MPRNRRFIVMTVLTLRKATRFRLDRGRLAADLIARGVEPCGFDKQHRAASPPPPSQHTSPRRGTRGRSSRRTQVRVVLYALDLDALIVAVRENDLPPGVRWPLRQVATVSFEADEVADFGDESFGGCCNALRELLRRAEDLVPALDTIGPAVDQAAGLRRDGDRPRFRERRPRPVGAHMTDRKPEIATNVVCEDDDATSTCCATT